MILKNQETYEYSQKLSVFNNCNLKLPVRINFFLQKNIRTIITAATEIEQTKMSIAAEYGVPNETQTGYDIPAEHIQIVNQELTDLFNLEQDLPIHIFKLDDFEGLEFTYQQMSAIMFMIEE
jgi:hypothetical protein